ncbi:MULTISPECIES: serine hydrolase [Salegentibacter]|jgi:beta-lactamase class A|uniref:beta-lactamase n=1 Tax=Salegentibacter agarivorans TaxID=345907 RepID=A0A1I2NEB2_9FLAO|nr:MULTISPECIES: serine hydrolase [Salegentibacter]APS39690.1 serine hydrolase [Salegentibacter sp. T436]SFF99856.1 beta-lactamase class A [Salegentibacter agarivorans]
MKFFPAILFIFACFISNAQTSTEELQHTIDSIFKITQGDFAIAFKDLSEEKNSIFINHHEDFHAASTMKTPVMIEVFKQASAGKFALQDSLIVKNQFKSILDGSSYSLELGRDSGEHLYEQIDQKRSIEDLVTDMIIYSSNLATNIIIELVDAKNVNKTMRNLDAKNINVLRGVEDMKAYEAGLSNSTTAYDLMLIFEDLATGNAVNPEADEKMLNILRQQKHTDLIPHLLPENLKIANKTGWITGVHHDSALIELPDGRKYVLVLLSKNMEDMDTGTKMLNQVSKMIYEHVK